MIKVDRSMTGMGNDEDNNNLGLGSGMSKEEMECHFCLLFTRLWVGTGLRNKQDWTDDTKQELRCAWMRVVRARARTRRRGRGKGQGADRRTWVH